MAGGKKPWRTAVPEKGAVFLAGAALMLLCLELLLRALGARYVARITEVPDDAAYTVLCVGDSFTQGAGAPRDSSYPRQLQNILRERFPGKNIRVINFGEVAQNTEQLLERLPEALDKTHPDVVVLLSGMADFWNYWGYRDGTAPPRSSVLDRLRVARLAKLLWRETAYSRAGRPDFLEKDMKIRRPPPQTAECVRMTVEAGEPAAVLAVCKNALKENPADIGTLLNIAYTYLNSGRPKEALEWLKKAQLADPANPQVYIGMSNALGRDREAVENCLKTGAILTGGATVDIFRRRLDIPAWIRLDIGEALDLLGRRGVKVLLQGYPNVEREDSLLVSQLLKRTAAGRSLPFVDQGAVFAPLVASGQRDSYFKRGDAHCSAEGYRLMAVQVADALQKKGMIKFR